jgi:hypothetical protein
LKVGCRVLETQASYSSADELLIILAARSRSTHALQEFFAVLDQELVGTHNRYGTPTGKAGNKADQRIRTKRTSGDGAAYNLYHVLSTRLTVKATYLKTLVCFSINITTLYNLQFMCLGKKS